MTVGRPFQPAIVGLWFLLILASPLFANPAPPHFRDLADWARLQDLRTSTRGDVLLLTNRWMRFRFQKDSNKVSFNEVEYRLSDLLSTVQGRYRISQRDLDTLLSPLISPPKRRGPPIRKIAINAGHGGKDPGNIEGSRQEKIYTLSLAKRLAERLRAAGLTVTLIRDEDTFVPLETRAVKANKSGADLYISLHFNGFDGPGHAGVQGLETYCLTPAGASSSNDAHRHGGSWSAGNAFDRENITLAQQIHTSLLDQTSLPDRGVRRARFKELTLLKMPGVLVEAGYMTHPSDTPYIYTEKFRDQIASAIAEGVLRYKRLLERGTPE